MYIDYGKKVMEGKFGIPIAFVISFITLFALAVFGFIYSLVTLIASLSVDLESGVTSSANPALLGTLMAICFVYSTTFIFILAPWMIGMRRSKCLLTNQGVSGVIDRFYIKRSFYFSLEEIEKIKVFTNVKIPGLALTVRSEPKPFKIRWLKNANALYANIYDATILARAPKETWVEIDESAEPQKKEEKPSAPKAEEKEKSGPDSGMNYIEEIKGLKELLDLGVITPYEFETRKRALLK